MSFSCYTLHSNLTKLKKAYLDFVRHWVDNNSNEFNINLMQFLDD